MKTTQKYLLVTLVLVISIVANQSFAQSTILGNTLTGTSPLPNQFLGSDNPFDVVLRANNTERMRILQSNGNVGIGTNSPLYLLDINKSTAYSVL